MNRLQGMEVFVEVVERSGFTRAAHALRMAASTVSLHIANLEAHVGTTLINRTTRTMVLTDEGAKYYSLCKRVLGDIAEVEGSLNRSRSLPAGRLRIDVTDTFTGRLIMPVVPEFLSRYPDMNLDFTDSGHQFDADQLGADVMIRTPFIAFEDSRLVATPLGHTRSVCAAAPAYLARHGEPATPGDLLRHQCIGYIDAWSGRHWEWFFERDGKRTAMEVPQKLAYSHGEPRIEAAVSGYGVINDLFCDIKRELRNGQLKLVLEDWSWVPPSIHVLYSQNNRRSKKVRAFVNFLLEKYPPNRELDPPMVN